MSVWEVAVAVAKGRIIGNERLYRIQALLSKRPADGVHPKIVVRVKEEGRG